MRTLHIATRESPLALWQAEFVAAALHQCDADLQCTLLPMSTSGDRWLGGALSSQGGKGLFVKELETTLLDGRADLAVHSLKDVPMQLPPGLELACYLPRHDPHDALVGVNDLDALPAGAVIGTSSQRRSMLLKAQRPDLRTQLLRGNVNTRLAKLDAGEYAAILLAAAGLQRLGMAARIGATLPAEWMVPSPGQGILAIEIRTADAPLRATLAALNDPAAEFAARAERRLSQVLGGSCALPLAGHCTPQGSGWQMSAALGLPDGSRVIRARQTASAQSSADQLGADLAAELLARGGQEVLDQLASGTA